MIEADNFFTKNIKAKHYLALIIFLAKRKQGQSTDSLRMSAFLYYLFFALFCSLCFLSLYFFVLLLGGFSSDLYCTPKTGARVKNQ